MLAVWPPYRSRRTTSCVATCGPDRRGWIVLAQVARFSTHGLNDDQRSSRWEDWNRGALVGLNCHTPGGRGLRGEEVTLDLADLTLGHVQAERHQISRTARRPSTTARPARWWSMRSSAVPRPSPTALAHGPCRPVTPRHRRRPALRRTFPTGFAELAIKLPLQPQARQGPQDRQAREAGQAGQARTGADGAHVVRTSGLAALRVRTLARQSRGRCTAGGHGASRRSTRSRSTCQRPDDRRGGVGDRFALCRLLIEQHLADPRLSAPKLAGALKISERQLSRLFADPHHPPEVSHRAPPARAAALLALKPHCRSRGSPPAADSPPRPTSVGSSETATTSRRSSSAGTAERRRSASATCHFPPRTSSGATPHGTV